MVSKFLKGLVYFLGSFILLFLTISAGQSTSIIVSKNEHTLLIKDSMILNLLFVVGVLLFLYFFFARNSRVTSLINWINENKKAYCIAKWTLLFLIFIAGLSFVLISKKIPVKDQAKLFTYATEWINGDYSSLNVGEYLHRYHNQYGFMNFLFVFQLLFGNNPIAYQILNVFGLILAYEALASISLITTKSSFISLIVLISPFVFFVPVMYCTFCYGTIWGLAFALQAICRLILYFEKGKRSDFILSLLLFFFSLEFKSNNLIFLLGTIVFLLIKTEHKSKRVIYITFSFILVFTFSSVATKITENITHSKIEGGASYLSWVAMGLQTGEKQNGWYNKYVYSVYHGNELNLSAQKSEALETIYNRLMEFKKSPKKAVKFFCEKELSEWNNPVFQGFWINDICKNNRNEKASFGLSNWAKEGLFYYANFCQFLILIMASAYWIFTREKSDISYLFMITLIGGYVFHTFWEAKAQYTWPYFFLLIPLFIMGITQKLRHMERILKDKTINVRRMVPVLSLITILLIGMYLPKSLSNKLSEDTQLYIEHFIE